MISGYVQVTPSDVDKTSPTKNGLLLGTKAIGRDGSIYRWTLNGAVALTAGVTVAALARVANHTNMSVAAAAAVGTNQVTVTLGGTAVTQDQYADGTLFINTAAGQGQELLIVGHAAQATTNGNVTLFLAEPLTVALTTSSKATLLANQNQNVVIAPAAATSVVTGTTSLPVAAANYFWSQTRGLGSILSAGVVTANTGVIASAAVAGAVTVELAATVTARLGYAPDATVDTQYYPIFLQID